MRCNNAVIGSKFDPRGLYFSDDHTLLVSDASDPILLVTPDAFQVPEPSTLALFGFGLAGFVAYRRSRTNPGLCGASPS